jgi:uncharacterized protein (DUF779 family)
VIVEATDAARETVRAVAALGRSELVIVLGSGCCDSTAPFLFDHYLPEADTQDVGRIDGVQVLSPAWLARLYPDDERLTIDAVEDPLDDSLSLETLLGRRFVLRLGRPGSS